MWAGGKFFLLADWQQIKLAFLKSAKWSKVIYIQVHVTNMFTGKVIKHLNEKLFYY